MLEELDEEAELVAFAPSEEEEEDDEESDGEDELDDDESDEDLSAAFSRLRFRVP